MFTARSGKILMRNEHEEWDWHEPDLPKRQWKPAMAIVAAVLIGMLLTALLAVMGGALWAMFG